MTGIKEPVWYYGNKVGTRIKRSDSIFRLLLIASNKKKYGRMGAVARQGDEVVRRGGIRPRVATNEEVKKALVKALEAFGERLLEEDEREARGEPPPFAALSPPRPGEE